MGTLKEKLEYIAETKDAIKDAIEAKGVDVSSTATFRSYANSIMDIPKGGLETISSISSMSIIAEIVS